MPYTEADHDRALTRVAADMRTYPITYTNGHKTTVQAYQLHDAYTRAELEAPEGARLATIGNPY